MANEIDAACQDAGLWPDVVLSGHAHLYQRFSRSRGGRTIPYIVSGSGGHLIRPPRSGLPKAPAKYGIYLMEVDPIAELGYMTFTVDLSAEPHATVIGTFNSRATPPTKDGFVLDLVTGSVTTQ
jgi:hypothetical protein